MTMLIRVGFTAVLASLIMKAGLIPSKLLFWNDTAVHRSISLIVIFAVLSVVIYMCTSAYVDWGRTHSKIVMPVITIAVLLVIAVDLLNVTALIGLPTLVTSYAKAQYAYTIAIAAYFGGLFFIKRF